MVMDMDAARGELETWGLFYMKEYIHDYQLVYLQNRGAHSSVDITLTLIRRWPNKLNLIDIHL